MLLLQIRNWNKGDFGGYLDVTVGGHMTSSSSDHEQHVAFQEISEELGLHQRHLLDGLHHIGGYNHVASNAKRYYYNNEWRDIYSGELKQEAIGEIAFPDGEVAGLTMIPLSKAGELLSQKTMPIASGIKNTLPIYLAHLNRG